MGGFIPARFFMKWLTILFAIFIILVIISADLGTLPKLISWVYDFPGGDKLGHFALYGILTLLLDLTFFQALPHLDRKRAAVMIGLALVLLIGLEEFSQQWFANRTFSLVDLAFSYLGVVSFSWLALKTKK